MDARVNAHRHKKTAPEGAVLVSWQRRLRFVTVVLPGLDSQQNFGGFTGQGGFIVSGQRAHLYSVFSVG